MNRRRDAVSRALKVIAELLPHPPVDEFADIDRIILSPPRARCADFNCAPCTAEGGQRSRPFTDRCHDATLPPMVTCRDCAVPFQTRASVSITLGSAALEDVGVDHGGAHIFVTEEFLDGADVVAVLKKVGSEGMAEGVAGDAFGQAGLLGGLADGALQAGGVYVVAALLAGARVAGASGSRKEVLPAEFASGVGVFFGQGVGEIDFAIAGGQVFLVQEADAFDLAAQVRDDGIGQGDKAVFFAFAIADGDGFVLEVEVFDPQTDAFHQTKARAVEQLGHEFPDSVEAVEDEADFLRGENGGDVFGAFGGGKDDGVEVYVQDFTVEEEDGAEGLVLGGGGDMLFTGKVGEELLDFGGAHFGGVAFAVEEDVAFGPVEVGLFGAVGVVFDAQSVAHLVEEFGSHRC